MWSEDVKENYIKHALREFKISVDLDHKNIVKLYEIIEIDENTFGTVLELCKGEDLSHFLKNHINLPEKEAKSIIKQILNGLKYIHEHKVIHYDLKPQNILFHKGNLYNFKNYIQNDF